MYMDLQVVADKSKLTFISPVQPVETINYYFTYAVCFVCLFLSFTISICQIIY